MRSRIGPGARTTASAGSKSSAPSRIALSEWEALDLILPDLDAMRAYRLGRVIDEINRRGISAMLCFDPVNIRYITDCPNMQLWVAHNPCRAVLVSAAGRVILWDFKGCAHLSADLPLVGETRASGGAPVFSYGEHAGVPAARFATEVMYVLREAGGGGGRLAIDRADPSVIFAFQQCGAALAEGQPAMERAREIKSADEIAAIRCAIAACDASVAEMREAFQPGISEVELWSHLHAGNIKRGGEWIETRLLTSGPRTNPWYQECSGRIIEAGDIVAFDTDLIGAYGYCVDYSRSWLAGDGKPSDHQRRLSDIALAHVAHNAALIVPGTSFAEISAQAHRLPEEFRAHRYSVLAHGVGMADECPAIRYPEDSDETDPQGLVKPGMVFAVEAFVGSEHGGEGVKHEDMVLVIDTGNERLTHFPIDPAFAC
ncbi:M24 family metallopeptidase [Paraurantiacibacter namhicola]|uniref:Putative peptidase n=1 Tax=Paraurantiacibacter namhicola TaxID=645517 RepID=A0A1C7D4R6_9SPHN|nr:Xaa-Pro peptidase family protein [Paraurantiacibacter namhicola]ANU06450.1 putative peptidase [Paraurantiacibacter namhicola]